MDNKAQIQGYLYEVIIQVLMEQSGYTFDINTNHALAGRGAKHQIDAFGLSEFATPFVHSLRLLAEAKYKKVELCDVRSFYGVIQDISQNYFSCEQENIGKLLFGHRYTDMGVMFSAKHFTEPALRFSFAHNIFIVSYEQNPVMQRIVDKFESFCDQLDFRKFKPYKVKQYRSFFYQFLKRGRRKELGEFFRLVIKRDRRLIHVLQAAENLRGAFKDTSSMIAFILGVYPIHLLSLQPGLKDYLLELFSDEDEKNMALHFVATDQHLLFSIDIPNAREEIYFTLPKFIFDQYLHADKDQMLDAKRQYIRYITIPITQKLSEHKKVTRSLRFNYSRELTEQRFRV